MCFLGYQRSSLREAEGMANRISGQTATSTGTTADTELEVEAAVSSGEGQFDREHAIRERAYAIWEEEGRPEGHHLNHWFRAEAEINSAAKQAEGARSNKTSRQRASVDHGR
jgi:Protein of unknown function (DUF2934)